MRVLRPSLSLQRPSSHRRAGAVAMTRLHEIQAMLFSGLALFFVLLCFSRAAFAEVAPFVGSYSGSVELAHADGTVELRDMSVAISEIRKGFSVEWSTASIREDGSRKVKTYDVTFVETDRAGIFAAAMQRNVFGHAVQMDPMKGHPYVWGRITGQTLTVFSMFIAPNGDYEMQQYDRTLADGGLELRYIVHRNGVPTRTLSTFLERTK